MAALIRPIVLWRTEVDHQPGMLAQKLEPLAAAGANLRVVMGYRLPGDHARAAIEIFPVSGARATEAAQAAGFRDAGISALHVEGDNRAGLGHAIASALAGAGINIAFLLGQVSGARHTLILGFENREDADRAVPLIRTAAATPRKAAARRPAAKRGRRTPKRTRAATRRRR